MDANKKDKLSEIAYVVRACCLNCSYAIFRNDDWGLCNKHSYNHLKHNEVGRHLSIVKTGYCNQHTWSKTWCARAEHFKDFWEKARVEE